jgi:Kdo2-lipid IVA lauroyltransferase/acyltransferase
MQKILFFIAKTFIYLFSLLPFWFLYFLSDCLYYLIYYVLGYRRKVVRLNLTRSFPEKSLQEIITIEKKFYHYIIDFFLEMLKCFSITKAELQKRLIIKDNQILHELYKQNKNVIISMGHYGNHEILNIGLFHVIPHLGQAVYKPLKNPQFDIFFKQMREKTGGKMIAMQDAQFEISKPKDRPFSFFLVNDQSANPDNKAYRTTFLNQETFYFKGPERFAKAYDIPVVYCRMDRTRRGYYDVYFELITDKPMEVPAGEILEIHSKKLERDIIRKPELWFWSHKRWKFKLVDGEYQDVNYR